jgi:hypothetical protein
MEEIKPIVLWVTGIVAFLIIIASIILAIDLKNMEMPQAPVLSPGAITMEQERKAIEIANYKELTSTKQALRTNIFDFVVIKTLIPLFTSLITAVITYILATRVLDIFETYIAG